MTPIARLATVASTLVALIASPVLSDAKDEAAILALQQSAIAAGRRTVTVVAEGTATRTADKLAVDFAIRSGNGQSSTPVDVRFSAKEDEMMARLREARLPIPAEHSDAPPTDTGSTREGATSYVDRTYTMPVGSYDEFARIRDALKPITVRSDVVDTNAKLRYVAFRATSAAFEADRNAVELEARRRALANAKTLAGEHAAAVGMKLGPPMLIGPLSITQHGVGTAIEQGYHASGLVMFEMIE